MKQGIPLGFSGVIVLWEYPPFLHDEPILPLRSTLMEPSHQPLSQRTRTGIVLGVLFSLGMAVWFQLIRDEAPKMPQGYVLPDFPPPVSDADNGLVYLHEQVEMAHWPEIESGKDGHQAIIGWREPWDAARMQPLVDAAPAMRGIVEKALSYPAWQSESGPGTRSLYRSADLAGDFFQTQVRHFAEANNPAAAMEWIEPMFRLARRREESPISLADAMMPAGIRRRLQGSLMRVLALPGADDALLAKGFAMLESPTVRQEDILRGLALSYWRETVLWYDPSTNPRMRLSGFFPKIGGKQVPGWLIKSRFKPRAYHNLVLQHLALLDKLTKNTGQDAWQELRAASDWLDAESKLPL